MSVNGKLFARSLKGEFIEKTSDGWKIKLSPKSPFIPPSVGYFEDEDKTIFILTDEFELIKFLQELVNLQYTYY